MCVTPERRFCGFLNCSDPPAESGEGLGRQGAGFGGTGLGETRWRRGGLGAEGLVGRGDSPIDLPTVFLVARNALMPVAAAAGQRGQICWELRTCGPFQSTPDRFVFLVRNALTPVAAAAGQREQIRRGLRAYGPSQSTPDRFFPVRNALTPVAAAAGQRETARRRSDPRAFPIDSRPVLP